MFLAGSAEEVQAPELGKSQPLSQDGAGVTVPEQMCLSSVFMQFCWAHKAESSLLTPNGKRNINVLDRWIQIGLAAVADPAPQCCLPNQEEVRAKGLYLHLEAH